MNALVELRTNLTDLSLKYADVVDVQEVFDWLGTQA